MANIQPYLDNITNAEYGEEVRGSICDAIEVINEEVHTGISDDIAELYDATKTYSVGDLVTYEDDLYECISKIETAEYWTAAHWKQTVLADHIKDVSNEMKITANNTDTKINILHDSLNFDYDRKFDLQPNGGTGPGSIGIKREGNFFTLNNPASTPSALVKIKISGDMMRSNDNSVINAWTGIELKNAHVYKVANIYISGECNVSDGDIISVYKEGTHGSIGIPTRESDRYTRCFVYDGTPVSLVWVINAGTQYTNYKTCVILEDITESVNHNAKEESTRIDTATNLIDYGYTNADAIISAAEKAGQKISVQRLGTRIVVNGGGENTLIFIKISGTVLRSNSSTEVKTWTGITLKNGVRYRVKLRKISGVVSNGIPSISVYNVGATGSIGTRLLINEDLYIREFTCPNNDINLIFYVPIGTTFTNAVYDCVLQEMEDEDTSVDTFAYYNGERINALKKIRCEKYMTISNETSNGGQGATAYGDYMFIAYNKMPMISVYNIRTRSHVYNIPFTEVDTYHCNNINFGNEKYDANDYFPLLYVSQENINEHKCLVFRITEENNVFSATLVQTITYPIPADVGMFYPNAFVDTINGFMFLEGYSKETFAENEKRKLRIMGYDLPKLSEGDVTLDPANAFQNFTINALPTSCQGGFINGDKIVQAFGNPSKATEIYLSQISMSAERFVTLAELNGIGITEEPESVFLWEGHLYYFMQNRDVYKLYCE